MTAPARLVVALLSDTAFSRGEPTATEVDVEVEHDEHGLPFLGGKALHGLLRDTWLTLEPQFSALRSAAGRVLGAPGDLGESAILRIDHATLPPEVSGWIAHAVTRHDARLPARDVLRALTDVRSQTAEERATGAPARGTLRRVRVALRGLELSAMLTWLEPPQADDVRLLALCALGTRHGGLGRNRGLGHLGLSLDGDRARTVAIATGKAQP